MATFDLSTFRGEALIRLQQALIAQAEAEAEQQAAEARRLQLANDPLAAARLEAGAELFRSRRDVRPMTAAEEADFLGAGQPLQGGVEGVAPLRGAPLRPPRVGLSTAGDIEGLPVRPVETVRAGMPVLPVRGGRPRITEGAERPPTLTRPGPRATPLLPRPSRENFTAEFAEQLPQNLTALVTEDARRASPPARSRTAFTDRDTAMTAQRMEAERVRDPNFLDAYAGREAAARLHPPVLAAEAYAKGRTVTGERGAADAAEQQFIDTNLPVLTSLAQKLNQLGGLAGRTIGATRKYVTGPLALNDAAREFNRIREPLSLVLASRFNGGRPTEPDRQAAAKVLADLGDSPELTQALSARIYEALADPSIRTITNPATGQVYQIRSGGEAAGASGLTGPSADAGAPRPGTRRQINGQWAIWDGRGWAPE